MLKGKTYQEIYETFRWKIPTYYNIGLDICDKWATERYRLALIYEDEKGEVRHYTFWDLKRLSDRLANAFTAYGLKKGDRVGILLPQCPETALSHIALYKIGAVAVPLFTLFGPEALEYRLNNSRAKAVITDGPNLEKILEVKDRLSSLEHILCTQPYHLPGIIDFHDALEKGSSSFSPIRTRADDPALIIYTSGTTGPPKGALHAHRVLLGHLPGVEFFLNFFPRKEDLYWTPADWAWIGGLLDVLFPSWHYGVPVVAFRARKFDPEEAFALMARYGIRNAFLPPTALKLMRQVENPRRRHDFHLRSVGSGGETLGEELLSWGQKVLDLTIHEFYGQTEANLLLANCSAVMPIRPGSMGRPVPGRRVEVVDETGHPSPVGAVGEVAVLRPDPVMFLEYWNQPQATREKFIGDFCLTGDLARKDEEGYFYFVGRKDDLITSAGYRIGPAEIEECLIRHPSVSLAGVIGSPDDLRGEIVKAYIVLKPGVIPSLDLEKDIQAFVKNRLAAHEYPREIEFIEELPLTATGKIMRKELRRMNLERIKKDKEGEKR